MGVLVDQLECFFRHANASSQNFTQDLDLPSHQSNALSAASVTEGARSGALKDLESAGGTIRKTVEESLECVAQREFQCVRPENKCSRPSEEILRIPLNIIICRFLSARLLCFSNLQQYPT